MKETETTMEELIERLEKATGPWRMLDVGIFNATTGRKVLLSAESGLFVEGEVTLSNGTVPAYTSSIDAALTLVPMEDDIWLKIQHARYDGHPKVCTAGFEIGTAPYWHGGMAATFPLALCIAALRARQA